MFSWSTTKRPILALAPMAGYTDTTYRQLVKEVCPSVVCFTEFTSVDGILHGNDATMRQIFYNPDVERPIVAQIFGKKPENFFKAAQVLVELGVDAVDINMGCPAKKIISSDHGSALLKNMTLAGELVKATCEGTQAASSRLGKGHIPVSVKMRVGTNCYDADYFTRFTEAVIANGAELLTIHGRTSKQMYMGTSDWTPIYELKKRVGDTIAVIGNGDVKTVEDATSKLQNLDGVMIGRGSFGNPWVFLEIQAAFSGKPYVKPTNTEKLKLILRHIELSCAFKGEKWGMLEMRKHYGWYIKGFANASEKRKELMTCTDRAQVEKIMSEVFESTV